MSTRFFIVVDGDQVAASEQNQITRRLEERGWKVWHWIECFWLVVVQGDAFPTKAVADEVRAVIGPKRSFIVQDVAGEGFQAQVPPRGADWITRNWDPLIAAGLEQPK